METRGLEPVPESERTGPARTLFPTWADANPTVPLLTMGAGLIALGGLNFWQVPAIAIAGPVISFGLVGLVSIAGKEGGAPGMALSRAVFGQRGNLLPGALIRIARWGWETVNAITGTYAVLAVLNLLFGIVSSNTLIMVTLVAFAGISFLVSGLGVRALRACPTWSTYLFGCFSVLVLIPRAWAVGVNAVISLFLGALLMMTAAGFMGSFVSFLTLLAVTFPAWIGVFGVDQLRGRTYDPAALLDTTPSSALAHGRLRRLGRGRVGDGPGGGPAPHRRGVVLRTVRGRLDRAPRAGLDGHDRRLRRAVRTPAAARRTGPRGRTPE